MKGAATEVPITTPGITPPSSAPVMIAIVKSNTPVMPEAMPATAKIVLRCRCIRSAMFVFRL